MSSQEHLQNTSATWHDIGDKWRRFTARLWKVRCLRSKRLQRSSAEETAAQKIQHKVPNTKSKKQLILDYSQERGLECVGTREIRAIEAELRRHLGPDHRTAPSYIANVLRQAGARVQYNDPYVDPAMEEPYASRLKGLLQFNDFENAEASLLRLDAVYREYRAVSDRFGTSLVRALALKGKQRAESLASNSRVSPEKRREKHEIGRWFRVWLEVSDLFFDWLELRKRSEDFQKMFGRDGQGK